MNIYERILHIDERTFDKLMFAGILRSNAKRDMEMYGYYLEQKNMYGSMQAISNAAEKFCLSEASVRDILCKLKNMFNCINNNCL
jgi:hypothetical protein